MNRESMLEFMNRNRVFFLATAAPDGPHVRAMMLYKADVRGIVFHTGRHKDLCGQLHSDPRVEACFYSPDENRQLRICGRATPLEDPALKREIVENYPFLRAWIDREGFRALAVFCVPSGKAVVWTMESNFAEKQHLEF